MNACSNSCGGIITFTIRMRKTNRDTRRRKGQSDYQLGGGGPRLDNAEKTFCKRTAEKKKKLPARRPRGGEGDQRCDAPKSPAGDGLKCKGHWGAKPHRRDRLALRTSSEETHKKGEKRKLNSKKKGNGESPAGKACIL